MQRDVSEKYELGFQDAGSEIMGEIINFHNYVMIYIVYILIGVLWILWKGVSRELESKKIIVNKHFVHGTLLETIWTILPGLVLIWIGYPSLKLIYIMDEVVEAGITIKVIGHQWYWSYEYSDYKGLEGIDSYMIGEEDLEEGELRLLEVDNKLVIPVEVPIRVIITSGDVLHSFGVPSLGIKLDAVPGRLNQTGMIANREGVYYGQCSEICGANHGFMPIVVEGVSLEEYCTYIESVKEK